MNRIAVRDDKLILWGMEATPLDLYVNMPNFVRKPTDFNEAISLMAVAYRLRSVFLRCAEGK